MKDAQYEPLIPIVIRPIPQQDLAGTGKCYRERESGFQIDTLIVHSCYVEEGICEPQIYPGRPEFPAIHAAIKQTEGPQEIDPYSVDTISIVFQFYGVAAHYVIDREGTVFEFVPPDKHAFHAGASRLPKLDDPRERVSDFSIGVELIGTKLSGFTDAQYEALARLTLFLLERYPIRNFFGHSDIAPDRKTDPELFDWERYKGDINFDPATQSAPKQSGLK